MQRSVHLASVLGRAIVLLAIAASMLAAQRASNPTADALTRMRVDLLARRYAAVIAAANGVLESSRPITTPQRIELWQLLAAAYYPADSLAQQPDSAELPLSALIRLAPDFKIAPELSWSGLDSLTERTRVTMFVVVTRPLPGYTLSARSTGHLEVVASRPTRLRLTSVDDETRRTAVHDSSAFATVASLRLKSHDAHGPIFTDGAHELVVWAVDLITGDSVRIAHRVRALRNDFARPSAVAGAAAEVVPVTPISAPATTRPAVVKRRPSTLWGGLALAVATAAVAQEARPDDGLRSAFAVDSRAFIVGAVMAGAAVANALTRRASVPPANVTVGARAPPPPPRSPPADAYRVRLHIDPPER